MRCRVIAKTIPVRLPDELLARLDAYAKSLGVSRSAAIKLALGAQMGMIESAAAQSLHALDGRTFRYRRPPPSVLRRVVPPGQEHVELDEDAPSVLRANGLES